MYHVIGTLLTIILLYFLSYFFYRNDIYSLQLHRKLWNFLLATVFIVTASAGLFLALQITYKWNIPVIKSILKWHVEFGIGLTATGLLHLFWHLSYFRNIFSENELPINPKPDTWETQADISSNLFIVGFTSTAIQLLLLKEIMNISGGYELVAGTFLGSWLIGSAAGSFLASRSSLYDIRRINLVFFSAPVITVVFMLLLSRLFLKSGETPSFLASVIYTFIVLIPFCLISGFTFIKLISKAGILKGFHAGKSYSVETAGGIFAGIAVSFLSTAGLNTYQAILLLILLGFSYSILSFFPVGKKKTIFIKFSILITAALIITGSPDRFFRQLLLRGLKVTQSVDTPYGNITKGKYAGEESIYYDHRLLFYNDDAMEREEDIHYAMLQLDNPESVLLISGSLTPHVSEISKYPVNNIVFVERDPSLIINEASPDLSDRVKLTVENKDAYSFVKNTREKFDASIMLLPPPSSLLINRYYTAEFFNNIKKSLKPGGVFACSPGINPDYLNKESVYFFSSVYNSLKSVFKNVIPVSGNKLYLLASDKAIKTSFCELAEKNNIRNIYVGPDYLADDLVAAKSVEVLSVIDKNIKKNSVLTPKACFYFQTYNLSKDLDEKVPVIVLLVILFLLPLFSVKKSNMLMYFSSSALAGFEIILLLVLQSAIGNMYQVTGLILAGLMAGLAVGAGADFRLLENRSFRLKSWLLIFCYLGMYFAVKGLITLDSKVIVTGALMLSGFVPAMITGSLFREFTATLNGNSDCASVYSADMAGSAIGCIVFSGVAVPIIGIELSLLIFPVLIFTGFLFTFVTRE